MQMLVGNEFRDSSDGHVINIVNPAYGTVIDTVPAATYEDVKLAIDTAVEGQKMWEEMTIRERTQKLKKFASLCLERREELGKILAMESGKPFWKEAVWELDSVAYTIEGSCEVAKHYYGKTMPIGTEPEYDHDIQFTIHEPLGVLACIIPYNFPPAIWSFKVGAALAAGNAVIVKAPSYNPLTLLKLHEMLVESGVPASVVQCITGRGSEIGNWLMADERIAGVNFTGSTEVGIDIAKNACKNLIPYQFELGGNDPFIVFEDADLDLAVKEAGDQCRNNRQCCTGSKRFIIHNSLKKEFIEKLIEEYLCKEVQGDPLDENVTMGPMISEKAAKTVEEQVKLTVEQGGVVIYGGKRTGAFFQPTIIDHVSPDTDIARDMEVFGPVWPIIGFDTFEEAVAISNHSRYGLGGGVFSRDIKTCMKAAKQLKTGHIAINGSGNFRAAELPFGGGKRMSGNSRESLSAVMDEVTQSKSIVLRYVLE